MINKIFNKIFKLKAHDTDFKTEMIAGITIFLTMLYIVPTNALILSKSGMPFDALITATAFITMIATILNGFWSNTPIAMSVGMGINAYFSYGLVKGMGIPWQTALGIVFIAGIILVILTLTPFRQWMIESVPDDIKSTISAAIGLFLAFIGLKEMGIIAASPATLVTLGNVSDKNVLLGIFGIGLVCTLYALEVKGAFILSIVAMSILGWSVGITDMPTKLISLPASIEPIAFELDIASALTLSLFPVIVVFLVTDLFDTLGTLTGIGSRAGIFENNESNLLQKALEADASATVLGSLVGVSTITSFIESATGVEEGGRTGLTAVVTGILFFLPLFLLPLFKAIPSNAIYPVLVMVGGLMFIEIGKINFKDIAITFSSFVILLMMPLTFSITYGIASGILTFFILLVVKRRFSEISKGLLILVSISLIVFLFR